MSDAAELPPIRPEARVADLLAGARASDKGALEELFELVYEELHALAHAQRRRWSGNYTLNTTALVHEAYLKLAGSTARSWKDRAHFLAVAARAMRQILVNYAERQSAAKRGGEAVVLPLEAAQPASPATAEEILALDEALGRLESRSRRQARVVECRFFTGLDVTETAEVLGVSAATVKRDWALASAWLYQELRP